MRLGLTVADALGTAELGSLVTTCGIFMFIAFIHGPIASGKHTIGTHLSAMTGLPLFHNHIAVDAALSLFPFGTDAFKKMRAAIWLTAFAEAAKSGRSFIFTFSPESTVDATLIDQLANAVASHGGKIAFIELRCSREAILKRLGSASRSRFNKLTDPDLFVQIDRDGGFDFPPMPSPLLSIDSEAASPESAAASIAAALSTFE